MQAMARNFSEMLNVTRQMTVAAGEMVFAATTTPPNRGQLYQQDIRVNQLERLIRKQVVAHLSLSGNRPDVPYSLLLVSLVKDLERVGDYAKNLSEVRELHPQPLPDSTILNELRGIREEVEQAFHVLAEVFDRSDRDRASELIRRGRETAQRCEAAIERIAAGDFDARTTAALVLAARYYKRIGGHVLNVLSSVVMPLHKIDYYDENETTQIDKD